MWVDAFLIVSSIYVTAYPECADALLKYMHTVRSRIKVKTNWAGGKMMSSSSLRKDATL